MKNKIKTKQTAFRTWKSGKSWLFSVSVLTLLAGTGVATETAHADTTTEAYLLEASAAATSSSQASLGSLVSSQTELSAASPSADPVTNISAALNTLTSSATVLNTPVLSSPSSYSAILNGSNIFGPSSSVLAPISSLGSITPDSSLISSLSPITTVSSLISSLGSITTVSSLISSLGSVNPVSSLISSLTSLTSSAELTSSTVATVAKNTSTINLSSYVNLAGSLYHTTLGSAISQAVQQTGVSGTIDLLSNAVKTVAGLTQSVPLVNSLVSTAQGLLSGIVAVESYAALLGLTPALINAQVANLINTGIVTIGVAANAALSPVLQQIPVVGSALNNFINPLLSNLTNVSLSGLISDVAQFTGSTWLLNAAEKAIGFVTPTVVAAGQFVIDTLAGVYNFVAPIFNGFLGALSPITGLVNNYVIAPITNLIKGAIGLSAPTPKSAVASNISVLTSSISAPSSSIAAVTPNTLITKDLTLVKGGTFSATSALVNAFDANGSAIAASAISVIGKVNTRISGQYAVIYSYKDPATEKTYSNTAVINVVDSDTAATTQTSLSNLNSQLSALPAVSISNPTLSMTSTTNWPSSQTVILPAPSSAFVVDVNQINSYYINYVNELRAANGFPAVSYSASQQAIAQSRAAQIVTDFSHDGNNISAENIAGSGDLVSKMQSNQEIAYYMVMDWYDETDNPETVGAGHYGHRANLLYSGPQTGIGMVLLPNADAGGFDEYSAMESVYTQQAVVDQAVTVANSKTNPSTIPLPKLTFKYVDASAYKKLQNQISALGSVTV